MHGRDGIRKGGLGYGKAKNMPVACFLARGRIHRLQGAVRKDCELPSISLSPSAKAEEFYLPTPNAKGNGFFAGAQNDRGEQNGRATPRCFDKNSLQLLSLFAIMFPLRRVRISVIQRLPKP